MLVSIFAGEPLRQLCEYNANFPRFISSSVGTLVLSNVSQNQLIRFNIRTTSRVTYSDFQATFRPDVNISVPDFDDNGDNRNDFAGARIRVEFDRVRGSHTSCSRNTSFILLVDGDGDANYTTESNQSLGLVNIPRGETSPCEYDVEFPATVTLSANRSLVLSSTGSGPISTTVPVTAAYVNGQSQFTPSVHLRGCSAAENILE